MKSSALATPDGVTSAAVGHHRAAMLFKGTEEYGIATIAKVYAGRAPEILFVCAGEGSLASWLRNNGNPVEIVPMPTNLKMGVSFGRRLLVPSLLEAKRGAQTLRDCLDRRQIRIVHTHWYAQNLVAGFLRPSGFLSVWQINNYMKAGRFLGPRRFLHQRIARWGADLLLPASDYVAADWRAARVPSVTIRNGAEACYERPAELAPEPLRCLTAGRVIRSKGFHTAIDAVITLRREGIPIVLDVAGGPLDGNAYARELQNTIDRSGEGDAIRLLGQRSDLRELHASYHLAVQCRIDPEPCSLWVCEAQVDGLAVVGSASGGTPELIEHGVTGYVYAPGDARELTSLLRHLARSPAEVAKLRAAAFERARRTLTAESFVESTRAAYDRGVRDRWPERART